jgi:hypothetical protein
MCIWWKIKDVHPQKIDNHDNGKKIWKKNETNLRTRILSTYWVDKKLNEMRPEFKLKSHESGG